MGVKKAKKDEKEDSSESSDEKLAEALKHAAALSATTKKEFGKGDMTVAKEDSCKNYGCGGSYEPGNECQCNKGCFDHDSCCHDYKATCMKADDDDSVSSSQDGDCFDSKYESSKDPCHKAVTWAMHH